MENLILILGLPYKLSSQLSKLQGLIKICTNYSSSILQYKDSLLSSTYLFIRTYN